MRRSCTGTTSQITNAATLSANSFNGNQTIAGTVNASSGSSSSAIIGSTGSGIAGVEGHGNTGVVGYGGQTGAWGFGRLQCVERSTSTGYRRPGGRLSLAGTAHPSRSQAMWISPTSTVAIFTHHGGGNILIGRDSSWRTLSGRRHRCGARELLSRSRRKSNSNRHG